MLRILPLPYLLVEFIFAYFFVSAYGFGAFVLEILVSGILGLFCIFQVGFMNLRSNFGKFGISDIFSSFGIGIAGFFLLVPGILCDIIGMILAVALLLMRGKKQANTSDFYYEDFTQNYSNSAKNDSEIIDVEVVSEPKSVR